MSLGLAPLGQPEVRPDIAINAAPMPIPPAPTGVGDTDSTFSVPAQCEGCYAWIGERFSALGIKLQDLLLSIRDWLRTWFVPPQADNSNPVNGGQANPPVNNPPPNPQPNPPVNNPLPNPQPNPPPNPPVNNLQPTAELILQTFGDEIRFILMPMFTNVSGYLQNPDIDQAHIEAHPEEMRAHFVNIFDAFPEMVQRNIMDRMEELKREANPGVVLVDNWAHRVIRGEIQYPGEAAPIATAEERNIVGENHFMNRAIAGLFQQLGGQPNIQFPATLRMLKIDIEWATFGMFVYKQLPNQANADANIVLGARQFIVDEFLHLPEALREQVKARMVQLSDPQEPLLRLRLIPDWTRRVIEGRALVPGEPPFWGVFEIHLNILEQGSLFRRAIDELIQEAPIPQPAQA